MRTLEAIRASQKSSSSGEIRHAAQATQTPQRPQATLWLGQNSHFSDRNDNPNANQTNTLSFPDAMSGQADYSALVVQGGRAGLASEFLGTKADTSLGKVSLGAVVCPMVEGTAIRRSLVVPHSGVWHE